MQRELRLHLGYYSDLDAEPSVNGFFVNLVRDNMAMLTATMHRESRLPPQDGARLAEAMANIGHAAEAMGYPVVKAMLDEIGAELPRKGKGITPKQCARIADKLSRAQILIRDMVCLVETGAI